MPVCPKCHSNVKEGQKFCNVCGTNVPVEGTGSVSSGPVKVFCEQCGRELNRAMKFCKYCGASQKNFIDPSGRGTEVITTPATPTADMQPETANQSATEVISQPVPYPPPHATGPAGPSNPTQVMNEVPRPSTEPIKDERTGGFSGTTGAVQGSSPIDRGYSTGETFRPAVEQSTEYFTHDLRDNPSGPVYSAGSPTTMVTPSQELEKSLPTTDKFSTVTDQPTAPVNTTGPRVTPSGPTFTPTAPVNTAPHVTPSGPTPPLPPTAGMGTQPFATYVPNQEPTQQTRTVPLPADQPAYSTLPPTVQVQQKKKGGGLLVAIAAVLVLLLGGGALGGYFLFFRNHNDNNGPIAQNGGGPSGGNQPSGGDSGGQPSGGALPTPDPNAPNDKNKPEDKNKDAGKDKNTQQPNTPNNPNNGQTGQSAEEQRKAEEARRAEEQKKLDDQKRASDEQAKRDQQAREEQARRDEEQRKIEEQKRLDEQKRIEDEKRRQAEANIPRSGNVFWAANIQGEGQYNVVIRGGSASAQTIVGPSIEGASVQFSNAIPQRAMRINLRDVRGKARVVQSPGPSNGYVTIIQVQGKNQRVSFTLSWDLL